LKVKKPAAKKSPKPKAEMVKRKYRAIFITKCVCGARHGTRVEYFEAYTDGRARRMVQQFLQDHIPEKTLPNLQFVVSEFKRIDQEEKSTLLKMFA
jgi:hypothetical protein